MRRTAESVFVTVTRCWKPMDCPSMWRDGVPLIEMRNRLHEAHQQHERRHNNDASKHPNNSNIDYYATLT